MATIDYRGDGGPDGTVLGRSTADLVGFHGVTPIARASVASIVTAATIATTNTTIRELMTALSNKGLITIS